VPNNIGMVDQWLRTIIGFSLVAMVLLTSSPWRWFGLIGLLPLATAILCWCPVYSYFGFSTDTGAHKRDWA